MTSQITSHHFRFSTRVASQRRVTTPSLAITYHSTSDTWTRPPPLQAVPPRPDRVRLATVRGVSRTGPIDRRLPCAAVRSEAAARTTASTNRGSTLAAAAAVTWLSTPQLIYRLRYTLMLFHLANTKRLMWRHEPRRQLNLIQCRYECTQNDY